MDVLATLRTSLASRYLIEREIGRGGMATVYLARDVRHARNVAVKVLNPELGAVLGVERFLSEIQVTANLQHPHLLPLFDSGEAEGLLFYVMPYIEGESLRARLQREKQLPIDESLRLATAVLSALHYAHRHGVIHRDLKPENILLHEGQPLVADFGIALAVSVAGGERITQTGISLGTPNYMSPEQATGDRPIDQRSDIYSLGAVLYEILTGDPPHTASTSQGIIAKVLTETPRSVRGMRPHVPPHVDAALERALEKLPADRWSSAHEFAEALQGKGVAVPTGVHTRGSVRPYSRPSAPLRVVRSPMLWALAFLVATGFAVWQRMTSTQAADATAVHFRIDLQPNERLYVGTGSGRTLAISPDGKQVAFASSGGGILRRISVRSINDFAPRALSGTEGAAQLSFSPDGNWIAFVADQQLKRVRTEGGPVTVLAEIGQTFGVEWGPGDQIVVSTGGQLVVLPGGGGTARPITRSDSATAATLRWPRMLADGKTVLFTWWSGGLSSAKIAATSLETGDVQMLNVDGTSVLGVMDGHLLYTTATAAVYAVPFDARRLRITGSPIPIVDRVSVSGTGAGIADLSASGSLVYQSGSASSTLVLVDTSGATRPLMPEAKAFSQPRFSPDGGLIAVAISAQTSTDIHIYSVASGTLTRLTTEGVVNDRPEWSADGKRVMFRSERDSDLALWWQPVDFSGPGELLLSTPNHNVWEGVLGSDGNTLVYRTGTIGSANIFYRRLSGADTAPKPIATTPFTEWCARISPDDRWVAYSSDDSRIMQVYVRPLGGPGARTQVSVDGGSCPIWSPDGRRLYYANNQQLFAASVTTAPTFAVRARKKLFESDFIDTPGHPNYDVSPNGRHFLMVKPSVNGDQVVVVHNWRSELRQRLSNPGALR